MAEEEGKTENCKDSSKSQKNWMLKIEGKNEWPIQSGRGMNQ